jgi:hypothetical protein
MPSDPVTTGDVTLWALADTIAIGKTSREYAVEKQELLMVRTHLGRIGQPY